MAEAEEEAPLLPPRQRVSKPKVQAGDRQLPHPPQEGEEEVGAEEAEGERAQSLAV